jgi:hypothetical protein
MKQLVLSLFLVSLLSIAVASAAGPKFSFSSPTPVPKVSLFDEEVRFNTAHEISQWDENLEDLYTEKNNQLCFPAALTHRVIYDSTTRSPLLTKLFKAKDLDGDGKSTSLDWVRHFTKECKVNLKKDGIFSDAAVDCIRNYYVSSGYENTSVKFFGFHADENDTVGALKVKTLRKALSVNKGVILLIGFYKKDKKSQTYVRTRGHYVNAYGYQHNEAWAENKINLWIVNPENDYQHRALDDRQDLVTLRAVDKADKDLYLASPRYVLENDTTVQKLKGEVPLVEDAIIFGI